MLTSTFRHIPGISGTAEQKLWSAGCCSWDCAESARASELPVRWRQAIDQHLEQFGRDIGDYQLLVTYSGKCFDLPFIRSTMGLPMDQAHIDLRYVLQSLGYGGGLKGCERKLGLDRGELDGVDGFTAVLLWRDYLASGNPRSLETLLAYNIQDVVNLETLAWRRHSGYCCRQTLVGTRTQGRPGAQRRSRCLCVSHPPCTRQVDQLPALPHR